MFAHVRAVLSQPRSRFVSAIRPRFSVCDGIAHGSRVEDFRIDLRAVEIQRPWGPVGLRDHQNLPFPCCKFDQAAVVHYSRRAERPVPTKRNCVFQRDLSRSALVQRDPGPPRERFDHRGRVPNAGKIVGIECRGDAAASAASITTRGSRRGASPAALHENERRHGNSGHGAACVPKIHKSPLSDASHSDRGASGAFARVR